MEKLIVITNGVSEPFEAYRASEVEPIIRYAARVIEILNANNDSKGVYKNATKAVKQLKEEINYC